MRTIRKTLICILVFLFVIIICIPNNSYAYLFDTYSPNIEGGTGRIGEIGNVIIGAIQFIGSIVSIIVLILIGIKYMVGSVEERAEYKKEMIPYIIGAVLLFSVSNLLAILRDILN